MKHLIVLLLITVFVFNSNALQIMNQNGCDCQGLSNCPCENKDILHIMRSGQERLMFKLNDKEKNYIQELNKQQKQKTG